MFFRMTETTTKPTVRPERHEPNYSLGEKIRFLVENGDSLRYTVTWDGKSTIDAGVVRDGVVHVAVDEPGYVRIVLRETDAPGEPLAEAAVAVAPELLTPTLPMPDDFIDFWTGQLTRLPETADPQIFLHEEHETDLVYGVSADTGDPDLGTVYAWLHVPREQPVPVPGAIRYHGAGVYGVPTQYTREWAQSGRICLSVNPHPIPNTWPQERYDELLKGKLANYTRHGRESRETSIFLPMFLRAAFVPRIMAALPEPIARWDRSHLVVEGHSQGGGQTFAAAALVPEVSGAAFSCPTHCDHAAPLHGRPAGWPQIVDWREDGPVPEHLEAARYFDGVNFATWTAMQGRSIPSLFGICYLDPACPPTGIHTAANVIGGEVTKHLDFVTAHIYTERFRDATFRWLDKYFPVNVSAS